MSLLHACPGCGRLIPIGTARCPSCAATAEREAPLREAESAARYNANRDPEIKRFYHSKAWQNLRAFKLSRDPLCEAKLDGCQRIACEVHHVVPVRTNEGWGRRLEYENLMSVCTRCHNRLDRKWGKATRRRAAGDDDGSIIDLSTAGPRPRGVVEKVSDTPAGNGAGTALQKKVPDENKKRMRG